MGPTDGDVPLTTPVRGELSRVAGEAIPMINQRRVEALPAEAVIAIMQAGRLVDEPALAATTPMQCRVDGYRRASLLRMDDDPDAQRLADELLDCIGVAGR